VGTESYRCCVQVGVTLGCGDTEGAETSADGVENRDCRAALRVGAGATRGRDRNWAVQASTAQGGEGLADDGRVFMRRTLTPTAVWQEPLLSSRTAFGSLQESLVY
jgi:hypothetical protein